VSTQWFEFVEAEKLVAPDSHFEALVLDHREFGVLVPVVEALDEGVEGGVVEKVAVVL